MKKTPVCRTCGGKVLYGNLYCSQACGKLKKATDQANADQLVKQGFSQDPDTPNIFVKDGVAVTLDHVAHIGITKTLSRHGAVGKRGA